MRQQNQTEYGSEQVQDWFEIITVCQAVLINYCTVFFKLRSGLMNDSSVTLDRDWLEAISDIEEKGSLDKGCRLNG